MLHFYSSNFKLSTPIHTYKSSWNGNPNDHWTSLKLSLYHFWQFVLLLLLHWKSHYTDGSKYWIIYVPLSLRRNICIWSPFFAPFSIAPTVILSIEWQDLTFTRQSRHENAKLDNHLFHLRVSCTCNSRVASSSSSVLALLVLAEFGCNEWPLEWLMYTCLPNLPWPMLPVSHHLYLCKWTPRKEGQEERQGQMKSMKVISVHPFDIFLCATGKWMCVCPIFLPPSLMCCFFFGRFCSGHFGRCKCALGLLF